MPSIHANTKVVTQINVFTVPEGGQQALIELLSEAAKFASTTPGWISASVHRSRDGTRVVNYAQCESMEAALRVIDRLREGGWLERNKAFGEAHSGLYDVVFTLEKQSKVGLPVRSLGVEPASFLDLSRWIASDIFDSHRPLHL